MLQYGARAAMDPWVRLAPVVALHAHALHAREEGRVEMDDNESLSHSKWKCKYHVIFIPKCRRKTLYEQLRSHLGQVFKRLSEYKKIG